MPVAAHGEQANDEEVVGVSRGLRRSRGIGIPFRCPRSATSEVEPLRPRSPCATIGHILFRWLFTPPYPTTLAGTLRGGDFCYPLICYTDDNENP